MKLCGGGSRYIISNNSSKKYPAPVICVRKDKKMGIKTYTLEWAGRDLVVEIGKLALQAHGSCTVRYGDTVVLATAVRGATPREGIDYFPLLVDYEERLYAAGKIKGSRFIKREGRPSDEAILTARMIDRSIRPLFPEHERRDVQVIVTVLSVDQENDPDIPALIAASLALSISPIPWNGPVAAVRVGRINDEWVLNSTYSAREKSALDLVVVGSRDEIIMLEAQAHEVPEDIMYAATEFGHKHVRKIFSFIEQITSEVGAKKDAAVPDSKDSANEDDLVRGKVESFVKESALEDLFPYKSKQEYKEKVNSLSGRLDEMLKEDNEVTKEMRARGLKLLDEYIERQARLLVVEKGRRVDGRALDEIRPLFSEVGLIPRTHGSGLFKRGETQVLSIVTLGAPGDEQLLDTMEFEGKKRYMHHYNFPGYSVGEVSPMRSPGRREIGHGALAEKAIEVVLPPKEQFPYTIRVVSEVLSSNGSTSQASVCGSSLALMDAGVPITKSVAGIAMGLVTHPHKKDTYYLLTDIQGIEDHAGDMDFKVAGTKDGITAMQVDIKLHGLSLAIVKDALEGARNARLKILEVMDACIAAPRKELSPYAPRITSFHINPEKIRDVIGPGGKIIREIIDETGVNIDIEDDGLVLVTSDNEQASEKAVEWIKNLTREVKAGEVFTGKVTRILDFGAFIEILPQQEGLLHISEIDWQRIDKVSDKVKVGDMIEVKVKEIDSMGRINLTRKELLPRPERGLSDNPRHHNNRPGRGPRKPFHRDKKNHRKSNDHDNSSSQRTTFNKPRATHM